MKGRIPCMYLKGNNYCKKHNLDVKKGRNGKSWYCWKWHIKQAKDEKGWIGPFPSCYIMTTLDAILGLNAP